QHLLTRRLGQQRAATEPAAVAELAGLCARLPLALSIVAAHAEVHPGHSLAAVAAGLREGGPPLTALDNGESVNSLRAVFSWSVRALSSPAGQMFRLLGLHPGPDIPVPAAAALAGTPSETARQALGELARSHLLTQHYPGRFTFHDLLRQYACEQAG